MFDSIFRNPELGCKIYVIELPISEMFAALICLSCLIETSFDS